MTDCNCCGNEARNSAWCDKCHVIYRGGTATGLLFYCPDDNQEVEVVLSFGLGFVEPDGETTE